MKIIIEPKIFEDFPELYTGVVVAKDVDNTVDVSEVHKITRSQEEKIRQTYVKETLSQEPKINAWRKAYSKFGVKSHDAKSSVETLHRLVLRGIELKEINPLVDIYNYISIKHMMPVGGEDLDKMQGDLRLAYARPDEPAVKLLGDSEPEVPPEGEIMYKDDVSAICRRWNWREAERTKLEKTTKNAVIVVEGIAPVTREEVETAANEMRDLIQQFCGGEVVSIVLHKDKTELEL